MLKLGNPLLFPLSPSSDCPCSLQGGETTRRKETWAFSPSAPVNRKPIMPRAFAFWSGVTNPQRRGCLVARPGLPPRRRDEGSAMPPECRRCVCRSCPATAGLDFSSLPQGTCPSASEPGPGQRPACAGSPAAPGPRPARRARVLQSGVAPSAARRWHLPFGPKMLWGHRDLSVPCPKPVPVPAPGAQPEAAPAFLDGRVYSGELRGEVLGSAASLPWCMMFKGRRHRSKSNLLY